MDEKVIIAEKEKKKELEKEKKAKEKQLLKQRTRIYNDMVKYQKVNLKRIKHAPQDAYISLRNINKIYDNKVQAVYNFNLDIKQHEFIVLVGPSGCGKSTTLRMIAGLEDITAGDLFIDKILSNELHPKDRNIAMVFQSYALYPHMTVSGNMAFGLRIKKVPVLKTDENGKPVLEINKKVLKIYNTQKKALEKYLPTAKIEEVDQIRSEISELSEKIEYLEKTPTEVYVNKHIPKEEIRRRVLGAAEILQIEDYLDRKPKALSGGQCQRVALGRAIVKNAKVFLMDEPLSNLDAKLRVQMRAEIINLHNSLNATTIYVTHDQTEAMTMASRIVVMNKGRVQQIGTPIEIYNHPQNMFVATFIGSPAMNLLNVKYSDGTVTFDKGLRIELTPDFKEAVDNYYSLIKESLSDELRKFDETFIERIDSMSRISDLEERIKNSIDVDRNKALLESEKEELRLIEESSIDRNEIISNIEELSKVDTSGSIDLILGIRPEDIYQSNRVLTDGKVSDEYEIVVNVAELLGHEYYIHTDFEGSKLSSKIYAKSIVEPGDKMKVVFDISKIHLFDPITKKAIK